MGVEIDEFEEEIGLVHGKSIIDMKIRGNRLGIADFSQISQDWRDEITGRYDLESFCLINGWQQEAPFLIQLRKMYLNLKIICACLCVSEDSPLKFSVPTKGMERDRLPPSTDWIGSA